MIKAIHNPKVIGGILVGFLLPKVTSYVAKKVWKIVKEKEAMKKLYIGIQLGGTNYNVAFGHPEINRDGKVIGFQLKKEKTGRTSENPQETLDEIVLYIKNSLEEDEKCYYLGIASFGPLQLNKESENYATIITSPKKGWKDVHLKDYFAKRLQFQHFQIDTDVNSAAFAEFQLGHHEAKQSLVYVTVGTGVGIGVISNKKTVHGLTHPEGGHIIVNRHPQEDKQFEGTCFYHTNCLESLTSNRSIAKRLNIEYTNLHNLEDSEKIWEFLGYYLAQLCLNITFTISPQVIVIGGGIMNRKIVFKYIHRYFIEMLNKYIEHPLLTPQNIDKYIKPSKVGMHAGLKGALLLKFL